LAKQEGLVLLAAGEEAGGITRYCSAAMVLANGSQGSNDPGAKVYDDHPSEHDG